MRHTAAFAGAFVLLVLAACVSSSSAQDPAPAGSAAPNTAPRWAPAPFCCPGCNYAPATCCCGRRGLVPVTRTAAGRTSTRLRTRTTTRIVVVATVTTTVAVGQRLGARDSLAGDSTLGDVDFGSVDAPKGSFDSTPLRHHELERRNVCPPCPAAANVTRGTPAPPSGPLRYCCPARPTVTVTNRALTAYVTRTRTVTATRRTTSTATVRQQLQLVAGRIFNDTNANYRFEAGEPPLANVAIQLRRMVALPGLTTRAARDPDLIGANTTLADGSFSFSVFLPPNETLAVVSASNPLSSPFFTLTADALGRLSPSPLVAAVPAITCPVPPVAGISPTFVLEDPAFASRVRSSLLDVLAAAKRSWDEEDGVAAPADGAMRPRDAVLRELGIGERAGQRCGFDDGGWRFAMRGVCAEPVGADGARVRVEMGANKTRCLAPGEPAVRVQVGASFDVKLPAIELRKAEEASPANGMLAAARAAPEFSQNDTFPCPAGYAHVGDGDRMELHDPVFFLLAGTYLSRGLNGTCAQITRELELRSEVRVLAGCRAELPYGEDAEDDPALSYLLRVFASAPCDRGGNWTAVLEGSATLFPYAYEIYRRDRVNLTAGAGAPTVPSARSYPQIVRRGTSPSHADTAPPPTLASRLSALFRRQSDNSACPLHGCRFALSALDAASSALRLDVPGVGNLFGWFPLGRFLGARAGATICSMTFKGSDLDTLGSNPLASWVSRIPRPPLPGDEVEEWLEMFASLPAVDELYYVLGFYTTQVPGVEYPEDAPNMQIAAAMNPCRNEYLFAFAGVETTVLWPEPPINITVSLDLAGFALDGTVTSDALGIVSEFWTPHGTRSVVVSGQTYFQGTASITLDLEPVALTFASSGIVLLDSDPRRNGLARVDVALAVQVSAAPSASLLDGMVEMDLSGLATATCATVVRYLTPSDWEFALQTSLTSDLGDFFQAMPQIGDLLADPIDQIFGGVRVSGQLDIYASPAGWGFRVCLDGTGALPQLGVAWKILTMYIPSLPSRIDACFSVGGPFSGTGFPIVATFRALGKPLSLYFCRRDWDCPGDHRCNSGLCATFGCPASYPNLQGILCYGSCRAGYTNVLGICWQNCPSRWTDLGVTCARDSDDPCPSGQEKQGGLCYPRCRSGFDGIGPVCWERCDDDYMDLGALCFRPAATRRKRCGCCHVRLRCRRWRCRWRKSCCDSCDDGFRDTGCTCFRGARTYAKKTYVRSPSSPIIFKDAYTIPGVLPRVAVAGLNW